MTKAVWIVFDLGFGDAGKGATVDFLVRERGADLVVRYNGGAQAGHNVVAPDGRRHTFSQIGGGGFVPGVRTLLGRDFVLHPGALLVEAERLQALGAPDPLANLKIDKSARVITPFQQAAGRLREIQRGALAHGTCGVGIGETVADALALQLDAIRAADLSDVDLLVGKLDSQQRRKLREFSQLPAIDDPRAESELALLQDAESVERTLDLWRPAAKRLNLLSPREVQRLMRDAGEIVFEGAQGVLLDENHGFHPHTTWSNCTPRAARMMLNGVNAPVIRLGVLRTYMVRHGPGPFPTHDTSFDRQFPETHNDDEGWQGRFRRGPLDFVLLRYALEVCGGVDGLALNCLDRIEEGIEEGIDVCRAYQMREGLVERLVPPAGGDLAALQEMGRKLNHVQPLVDHIAADQLVSTVEQQLSAPVMIAARGPSAADRCFCNSGQVQISTSMKR